MSRTVKLLDEDREDQTYTVPKGFRVPLADGSGMATAYFAEGSLPIIANGSYDVRDKAAVEVNVPTGGGAWWAPSGADGAAWTHMYFNIFSEDSSGYGWIDVASQLTYGENHECVVAEARYPNGSAMPNNGQIVVVEEPSIGAYWVAYRETWYAGTENETENYIPIYATADIPDGVGGIWMYAGYSADMLEVCFDYDAAQEIQGAVIPIIDCPTSNDKTGWDWLWAGTEIAFGHYIDYEAESRIKEIIANEEAYLDADDFAKWFGGSNGGVPYVRSYFCYGNHLLESVEFPPLLNFIGDSAFEGCTALETVGWLTQTSGFYILSSIGARAFYGCTSLETVDIQGVVNLSSIGDYAFGNCPNLKTVTIHRYPTPPTLGTGVFDTTSLEHIYVPATYVNAYKTASGWSAYANYIEAIPTT